MELVTSSPSPVVSSSSAGSLERSILKTLTYFDVSSFPLTSFEIWKWMYGEEGGHRTSLNEVSAALQNTRLQEQIETHEGFWVLKGRKEIITLRKERHLLAEKKHRRLQMAIRWFRCIPFIQAIAICNSAAYNNAREESDLDILVITDPKKMWTVRMFTAGISKLFGWRPTPTHTADGICLSFFISDVHASIQSLTLTPDDPYMRYWLDQLTVVYGDQGVVDAFRRANNWYSQRLPNAYGVQTAARRRVGDVWASRVVRKVAQLLHSGSFGENLERAYKQIQLAYLPHHLKQLANTDSRVVISETMLKFHDHDRRAQFADMLERRLQQAMSV